MLVGDREVGAGHPCFVIAEAGVNHNGSAEMAHALVDAAADAGADAVKFQTFEAAELVTPDAATALYQRASGERQLEMLEALQLAHSTFVDLRDHCRARGITFLSSPFDSASAALLEELGVPALKIGSGELTNLDFIAALAAHGLPLIISTGMANLDEVAAAVSAVRSAGADELVLLHCVSAYPAPPESANLRAMDTMRRAFEVDVGFSDHTRGTTVALAAVALGACILEKHLTLDRDLPGPDHGASLEPAELATLVREVRVVESALGDGVKLHLEVEADVAAAARRSLVAARDLRAGHRVAPDDLTARRPGTGIAPHRREEVIGRVLRVDLRMGTPFDFDVLE